MKKKILELESQSNVSEYGVTLDKRDNLVWVLARRDGLPKSRAWLLTNHRIQVSGEGATIAEAKRNLRTAIQMRIRECANVLDELDNIKTFEIKK
ncbi:MAG: hypothetical protein IJU61_00205 [Victivallales bacterium]|nr:hypothetical protein [Victivallales bacterium]